MKHIINIDTDKCIGCGMCVKDCPQKNIFVNESSKAEIKSEDCLMCGHCSAVCPMNAVKISGYSSEPFNIENLEKTDPERLFNSLVSRRSIRQFKDREVDKEIIDRIIEAGRLTPTGKNSQDVSYIIIKENKRKIEDMAVKVFRRLLKAVGIFRKNYRDFEIDDDFFFKGAPIVIAVVSDSEVDGALASANMALMAESYGLGVLYSGFFAFAVKMSLKLRRALDLKGRKLVLALVIGYPDVKYRRSTQKDDAEVKYM